jgi:hypothetical protein
MPDSRQKQAPTTPSPYLKVADAGAESEVVLRARHIVEQHAQLGRRSNALQFAVEGEMLVVRGSVPTYYLKQLVQTALKGLEGVRRIENQVEVVAGVQ